MTQMPWFFKRDGSSSFDRSGSGKNGVAVPSAKDKSRPCTEGDPARWPSAGISPPSNFVTPRFGAMVNAVPPAAVTYLISRSISALEEPSAKSEENRNGVAHQIPIAFVGVEFARKSPNIARRIT